VLGSGISLGGRPGIAFPAGLFLVAGTAKFRYAFLVWMGSLKQGHFIRNHIDREFIVTHIADALVLLKLGLGICRIMMRMVMAWVAFVYGPVRPMVVHHMPGLE